MNFSWCLRFWLSAIKIILFSLKQRLVWKSVPFLVFIFVLLLAKFIRNKTVCYWSQHNGSRIAPEIKGLLFFQKIPGMSCIITDRSQHLCLLPIKVPEELGVMGCNDVVSLMRLLNIFVYPTSHDSVSLLEAVKLSVLCLGFKYYCCHVYLMTVDKEFAVSSPVI